MTIEQALGGEHNSPEDADKLDIDAYLRLLNLTEVELGSLGRIDEALAPNWDGAMTRLYLHLRHFESTARLLPRDEERIAELAGKQVAHYRELLQHLTVPATLEHSRHIGEVHHRFQVHPRWQLGAFAQVIAQHAPTLIDLDIDAISAFIKVVAMDAAVALESYAVHDGKMFRESVATQAKLYIDDGVVIPQERETAKVQRTSSVRLLGSSEMSVRLAFFGLLTENRDTLESINELISPLLDAAVQSFYDIIKRDKQLVTLFSLRKPVSFEALASSQHGYLLELFGGDYDSIFTAKRLRVGKTHLAHQVPTSVYMGGVGLLLSEIVRKLSARDALTVDTLRAVSSALFFDASLVIEAYIEARREELLNVDAYASDLLKRLPIGVAVVDPELRILSTNYAFLDLFDLSADLLKDVRLGDAVPSLQIGGEIRESFDHPADGDRRSTLLEPTNEGDSAVMRLSSISIPSAPGEPVRRAVLFEDVSDVVDLSDRSRQLHTSFRRLVNNVAAIVWEFDTVNSEVIQIGGDTKTLLDSVPEDLLGSDRLMGRLFSDRDRSSFIEAVEGVAAQGGEAFEVVHRGPERACWFRTSVQVLDRDNKVVSIVSVDITGEVEARRDLMNQIEILNSIDDLSRRLVSESSPIDVLEVALQALGENFPDAEITIDSSYGTRQWGSDREPAEQVLESQPERSPQSVEPVDTDAVDAELVDRRSIEHWTYEEQVDASTLVRVSGSGEQRYKNGREVFGLIVRMLGLALRRIEDERTALRSQRFAAIGTVAGGVAHDFNNILSALSLAVEDLAHSITADEDAAVDDATVDDATAESVERGRLLHRLNQMANEIGRGKDLVGQMSTFRDPAPTGEQVNKVGVEAALELEQARRRWPEVEFEIAADDDLSVSLNSLQLRRLIANLLDNAAHSPGTSRVTLSIDQSVPSEPVTMTTGVVEPGRYVRLTVSDDGEGFASGSAENVFEPFFTTKNVGEGTGLGLTIVKSLAETVAGGVRIESGADGAAVEVLLREAMSDSDSNELMSGEGSMSAGSTTIAPNTRVLVIDDHEVVAEASAGGLAHFGHDADFLVDPHLALDAAQSGDYDVFLVDYNMPGLNGIELIRRARHAGVDGHFVIVSGYLTPEITERCQGLEISVIEKPITASELDRVIRALVNN